MPSGASATVLLLLTAGVCRHPAALSLQAERVGRLPALSSACHRAWCGPPTGAPVLLRLKGGAESAEEEIETEDDDAFLFHSGDERQQDLPRSLQRAVDEVRAARTAYIHTLPASSALFAAPARLSDLQSDLTVVRHYRHW